MHSDLYSCEICCNPFNSTTHIPKFIPLCGHTICSACLIASLSTTRECPFHKDKFPEAYKSIDDFTRNILVLQIVEQRLKGEHGTCPKHNQLKNLICETDLCQICTECVPDHKNHSVNSIETLNREAQNKKKQLTSILREFENHQQDIQVLLRESRKSITVATKHELDKIRRALDKKEEELNRELDELFEHEQSRIDEIIERDSHIKRKYEARISDLESHMLNRRFFRTLSTSEKQNASFEIVSEVSRLSKTMEVLKSQYMCMLEGISRELLSHLGDTTHTLEAISPNEAIIIEDSAAPTVNQDDQEDLDTQDDKNYESETDNKKDNQDVKDDKCDQGDKNDQYEQPKNLTRLLRLKIEGHSLSVIPGSFWEPEGTLKPVLDISTLKPIREVSVGFDRAGELTEKNIQALNFLFSCFEHPIKLNLNFDDKNFTDKHLTLYCTYANWAAYNVDSLSVNFEYSQVSYLLVIDLFRKPIFKSSSLKCLEIRAAETQIADQSIQTISLDPLQLQSLTSLCLELSHTKITNLGVIRLCENMRTVSKNLKAFRLDLSETYITDQCISVFTKEILIRMEHLDALELNLIGTQVTDNSVGRLCAVLVNIRTLKKLVIVLEGTKVTDITLSTLAKSIQSSMPLVEEIKVYVDNTNITNAGATDVLIGLHRIAQKLKTLTLGFRETQISDDTVIVLAKHLTCKMEILENFVLDVSGNDITNNAIECLCKALRVSFKNLKALTLNLQKTRVTEKALVTIVSILDTNLMPKLKGVNLEFDNNPGYYEIRKRLNLVRAGLLLRD